ncbi:protein tilB homolog [Sitophilus oryzae]|uniref:Protein tilB homolog n=1 Tax=Sitophilus oryzae TaxID=7048 RepID=A0A6J2XG33_SITOR|nr:protein tilB homolog [Sitophilus oryzae]
MSNVSLANCVFGGLWTPNINCKLWSGSTLNFPSSFPPLYFKKHETINKIDSLADFQFCKRLEELYIRQNDIRNLNEVVYLQNLPNLKNLWLGENPCSNIEGYRLAVIKALPQLQKLDNVAVTQEEIRESQKYGRSLCHPDDVESDEEYASQQQCSQINSTYRDYSELEYSPVQRSPPRQETEYEIEESEDPYPREEISEESREYSPPQPVRLFNSHYFSQSL